MFLSSLCLLLLGFPRMIPRLVPRLASLLGLLVFSMPVVSLLLLWLLRPLRVVLPGGVILAMTDEICEQEGKVFGVYGCKTGETTASALLKASTTPVPVGMAGGGGAGAAVSLGSSPRLEAGRTSG